ncbi:MAG: ABC transporter substrate-binding protein [Bacteroidetes bacterium]|jgi:iron complex transport system substrate-binding protein|nr:ABC transporter substrate-binding protein [Bacteroidota bacterium]
MRIASLLPAATEWVAFLDAADQLVGRSHECDYPASVAALPALTEATFASDTDSAAIDAAVQEQVQQGLSLYEVRLDRIRAVAPDLVLTQDQCAVCATTLPQVEEALAKVLNASVDVFSMQPRTLKEALTIPLQLGRRLNRTTVAMERLAAREQHLQQIQQAVGIDPKGDAPRPQVLCIEWLEPLMVAGHWSADLVRQAGGTAVLTESGARSAYIDWDDVRAADPDVIAVLPCGFGLKETRRDLHYLTDRPGWNDLSAVQAGRVALFDGNAYFNRPGPRLYRAIALLVAALHPAAFAAARTRRADLHLAPVASWEMAHLPASASPTPEAAPGA